MRFVSNQPHRKNVAQRRGNQMRILADKQFEACREIFIGGLVVHKNVPMRRVCAGTLAASISVYAALRRDKLCCAG
jgi:hypothetical protein